MNRREFLRNTLCATTAISAVPVLSEKVCADVQIPPALQRDQGEIALRTSLGHTAVLSSVQHTVSLRDERGKTLWMFDRMGTKPGALNFPVAAAFEEERGLIYVANRGNANVLVFNLEGKVTNVLGGYGHKPGTFASASDLALGSDGALYVCDGLRHCVHVLDRHGKFVRTIGSFGVEAKGLNGPSSIALEGAHKIHIADRGNQRIQVFTTHGDWVRTYGDNEVLAITPRSITIDPHGSVYVVDTARHELLSFTTRGALRTRLSLS